MSKRKTSRRRGSMQGKCYACGGKTHPFAIYEWEGLPKLRDAECPIHKTPLVRRVTFFEREDIRGKMKFMTPRTRDRFWR